MPEQDPLAQLRDIHLPDAVSAWPPAPGWWLLTALLLALLIAGLYWLRSIIRRNRYRRMALKQLNALATTSTGTAEQLQQINQLLKQTALAARPATDIAALNGEQWLAFLDKTGNTSAFSQGAGNALKDGPYSPAPANVDTEALHQLSAQWIKQHRISRSQP